MRQPKPEAEHCVTLLQIFHASLDLIDALGRLSVFITEVTLTEHGKDLRATGHGPTVAQGKSCE